MGFKSIPTQSVLKSAPEPWPFPKSEHGRTIYGLFVTIVPIISFLIVPLLSPEWQDGQWRSYLALSLLFDTHCLLFIALAYSVICYIFLMVDPSDYATLFFIRLGIYTGVLLSLLYSIIVIIIGFNLFSVIFALLVLTLPLAYNWAAKKWTFKRINGAFFLLGISLYIFLAIIMDNLLIPLFLFLAFILFAAPFWSFLLVLRASIWLYKNYETKLTLPRGLGITAWLAAYALALRFDILTVYKLYSRLPTTPPPDCYIATAAAQGHPRFVGSHTVQRVDGLSMRVNGQLQRLKCAELALMAVNPRVHKLLRRIYDVVGKALARRMNNPFVADVAYLMLKPAEWCAVFVLKVFIPEIESVSRRMYVR